MGIEDSKLSQLDPIVAYATNDLLYMVDVSEQPTGSRSATLSSFFNNIPAVVGLGRVPATNRQLTIGGHGAASIDHATLPYLEWVQSTLNTVMSAFVSSADFFFKWQSVAGDIRFRKSDNTDLLVIDPDGNIGIGMSVPTFKLHVIGGGIAVQHAAPQLEITNPTINQEARIRLTAGPTPGTQNGATLMARESSGVHRFSIGQKDGAKFLNMALSGASQGHTLIGDTLGANDIGTEMLQVVGKVRADTGFNVNGTDGVTASVDGLEFEGGILVEEGVYAMRYDEVDETTAYKGEAAPGTVTSDATWRIARYTFTGPDVTVEFADGDKNFDNIWDNRASLSYS